MKTLYILRHAKSSWDTPALADFDRPLNARGLKAAAFMGEFIHQNGFLPDVVCASPALRARETASLIHDNAGLTAAVMFDERIYEASAQTLRIVVAGLPDNAASAMIIGHNPGLEQIVRFLTGRIESMPTAALAVIDLDIAAWQDVSEKCGALRVLIRPKQEMKTDGLH